MLPDLFTKELQGVLFMKLREVIIGWKHRATLYMGPPSTKDRVKNVDDFNSIKTTKKKEIGKEMSYADIVTGDAKWGTIMSETKRHGVSTKVVA